MIDVAVPGFGQLRLAELVCDFNGTLARDGEVLDSVRVRFSLLAQRVRIHVVTADTFGSVRLQIDGLPCELTVVPKDDQADAKRAFVEKLGAQHVVAVGNGRNDRMMLRAAALGIGVCGAEGIATETLQASDVVVADIAHALDLLLETQRLVATLRD